jgi:hypothetical protein
MLIDVVCKVLMIKLGLFWLGTMLIAQHNSSIINNIMPLFVAVMNTATAEIQFVGTSRSVASATQ